MILLHNEAVYPVTTLALPFMLRLVPQVDGSALAALLDVLRDIATTGSEDPSVSTACRKAVERELETFGHLLEHPDGEVKVAAAKLIAAFPRAARAKAAVWERLVRDEDDPEVGAALLYTYGQFTRVLDRGGEAFLRECFATLSGSAVVYAALALARAAGKKAEPVWLDAIFGELAAPVDPMGIDPFTGDPVPCLGAANVVRRLEGRVPSAVLTGALARALPRADNARLAYDTGEALLYAAFRHRLGDPPATRAEPFTIVATEKKPLPVSFGNRFILHQLAFEKQYVQTQDDPEQRWSEPPTWGRKTARNIAPPLAPDDLSASDREALVALYRHLPFWETRSDLPTVYGLPAGRRGLGVLLELSTPWWSWLTH